MNVHVHIYKVIGKAEKNLCAGDTDEASKVALRSAKAGELAFGESECEYIAIPYAIKDDSQWEQLINA